MFNVNRDRHKDRVISFLPLIIALGVLFILFEAVAIFYDVFFITSLVLVSAMLFSLSLLAFDVRWFVLLLLILCGFQADYPFYITNIEPLGSTAFGRILFVDIGIISYLLKRFLRYPSQLRRVTLARTLKLQISYFFATLIVFEVLSLVNAVYFDVGAFQVLSSLRVFAVMAIVIDFARTEKDIWWIVKGMMVAYAINVIFAGIQLLNGGPLGLSHLGETQIDFRAHVDIGGYIEGVYVSGFTGGPYSLAGYLVLILPLIIAQVFTKGLNHKGLIIAQLGYGVVLLILAGSRGALLAFVLSVIAMGGMLLLRGDFKLRFDIIAGFLALLMLIGFLFGERIYLRFFVSNALESATTRMLYMQVALNVIGQNPLVGVGIANFAPTMAGSSTIFSVYNLWAAYGRPVHNVVLLWTAETGIPGAAFLLLCWFWALRVTFGLFMKPGLNPSLRYLALGLFTSFVGIIIHAQSDIIFRGAVVFMYYGVYLGLIGALALLVSSARHQRLYTEETSVK